MNLRKNMISGMKTLVILAGAALYAGTAYSQLHMTPSEKIREGTVSVLRSPSASVANGPIAASRLAGMGSVFIVEGITEGSGKMVSVILNAAGNAGKLSVQISKAAFQKLGVSAGATVNAVTQSTGVALVASGKVLAFIPNTVGQALLHHEGVPDASAE